MIATSHKAGGMMVEWAGILAVVSKSLVTRVPGQIEPSKAPLDRALRLVRHIDKIAALLSDNDKPARLDLVRIAALYISVPLSKGKKEQEADDAAELAADQLKDLVSEDELEIILKTMHEHTRRQTKLPEARLLADVVALEDVGLVGLWNAIGKYQGMGRSVEQFIRLWKKQGEYGYWETRLRDGFHYEVVRALAEQRLKGIEAIVLQMESQQNADDIS